MSGCGFLRVSEGACGGWKATGASGDTGGSEGIDMSMGIELRSSIRTGRGLNCSASTPGPINRFF